jgi:hypothetical protein
MLWLGWDPLPLPMMKRWHSDIISKEKNAIDCMPSCLGDLPTSMGRQPKKVEKSLELVGIGYGWLE